MQIIIDGNRLAAEIRTEIASEVESLKAEGKKTPHLAAILVGNEGSSETYVANKIKDCNEVGFLSTLVRFKQDVEESMLLEKIDALNKDKEIDGFIVQLPLPGHISGLKILESVDPV